MTKKYANLALVYAVVAMVFGVFFREFTKFQGFEGKTSLSVMHTHYFMLGMFFFLILMLIEKSFAFSDKRTKITIIIYQVGLNITGAAFLARGIFQVTVQNLERGFDASVSGIAGIGHIIMGGCIIHFLIKIRKSAASKVNQIGRAHV